VVKGKSKKEEVKRKGFPWLRVLVHLLGALPLAWLGFDALTGRLSVNPIQDIEQRLGRAALYFLVASLAVTPVYTLTGWRSVLPRRRALGLYAFLYASLHFITFAAIDYGFDLSEIGRLILEKPFILIGLTTGLLLLPLAITSFDYFMRKLGKRWKSLHRLVYIAGLTVILHYAWALKGSLTNLSGDILRPLGMGLLVAVLLILRIPRVRRWASSLRQRAK
jgi:sulfoxide reductase heme-binding subunit YedZ